MPDPIVNTERLNHDLAAASQAVMDGTTPAAIKKLVKELKLDKEPTAPEAMALLGQLSQCKSMIDAHAPDFVLAQACPSQYLSSPATGEASATPLQK